MTELKEPARCPHCETQLRWISSSTDLSKEDRVTHTDKFKCQTCGFQRTEKS